MSSDTSDSQDLTTPVVVDVVRRVVEQRQPERVIIAGPTDQPAMEHLPVLLGTPHATLISAGQLTRQDLVSSASDFELAVVWAELLTDLTIAQSRHLLAVLRDNVNGIVLVVSGPTACRCASWQLTEMIGMGYRRLPGNRELSPGWAVYYYDIHDYKTTPDWLNKKYWANPLRWDQERW